MADINVNFMHPTDGRIITVTVDDSMTAEEAIGQLLANKFIVPNPNGGYQLSIKGGAIINNNQTFIQAGVKDDTSLRVISATDAGAARR